MTSTAHHATGLALGLLGLAFVLCLTTWLAVSGAVDPALQTRHLALGGLGALASAAAGALLLTIQVGRACEADEEAAWTRALDDLPDDPSRPKETPP